MQRYLVGFFQIRMLTPDGATVTRRNMSIGHDDGFEEALDAFKQREKRRKSFTPKPQELEERKEESRARRALCALVWMVVVALGVIIVIALFKRHGLGRMF